MKIIKIGLVSDISVVPNRPFKNHTSFVNTYIRKVDKAGGISVGIVFPDGEFKENYLDDIDGILLTGGNSVKPYHLCVIHYALKNSIPILGICLGHQALGIYSQVIDNLKNQGKEIDYNTILEFYYPIYENEELFLKRVSGHNPEDPFYNDSIEKSQRKVLIKPETILHDIYKKKEIYEPSIHRWSLKESGKNFIISALSEDNQIEAIEHINSKVFALGVQFHPELEDKNDILFTWFINKIIEK